MKSFFLHNWLKVIYYNFRFIPLYKAVKLPLDIARNTHLSVGGKIEIGSERVSRGMISIGFHSSDIFMNRHTNINVEGKLVFKDGNVRIGAGTSIIVKKTGTCILHKNCCIGANSLILSEDKIEMEEGATFSWDCQIMDTDTHSLCDTMTGEKFCRHMPVYVGKDTWIGNHVIINKGTVLPKGTIVSSYSLCNKDYSQIIDDCTVIGGIPARKIVSNRKRMGDTL